MTITDLDLARLSTQVAGPVYTPDDPQAAAEAAAFNLAVAHRPAVVVGVTGAEDVAAAVRWAGEHDLPVSVQATGHGAVIPADGAVLLSTRRMQSVSIDAGRRSARVAAGARWREVVDASAAHELAPLCGSSSRVGVVGYTLGGGAGLLARQYGFAADLVTRLTMVTADGRLRVVDAMTEPELFWAVRGGQGNFGIVCELEFDLVPVAEVYGASVFFSAASAGDVLHAYREWAPTVPENTSTSVALLRLPPLDELPPSLRGQTVAHLRYAHNGPAAEGEALLAPMLPAGQVVLDVIGTMPFSATDAIHQDPTEPLPVSARGGQLHELPAEAIDRLLATAGPDVDSPLFMVEVRQLGGALARPAATANAVAGREGAYSLFALGPLAPGIEAAVRAGWQGVLDAVRPWTTGTTMLNLLGDATTPQQVAAAWTPDVHTRLLTIKDEVDPANMFRFAYALR